MIALACLLALVPGSEAFVAAPAAASRRLSPQRPHPRTAPLRMGLGDFAVSLKRKEVAALLDDLSPKAAAALAAADAAPADAAAVPALAAAMRKASGTMSVLAEYRRKGSGVEFVDEVPAPQLVSPVFREEGAAAASVCVGAATGGCSVADVEAFCAEQGTAAGDFPGPLPVLWNELVCDRRQLAVAKAAGAAGVTLSLPLLGAEAAGELAAQCAAFRLEVVAQVTTPEEVAAAVAFGAPIVAVQGLSLDAAIALRAAIPEGTVAAVHIPANDDKMLDEANDAWLLRDAGYNCAWVSELLYKFGNDDSESFKSIIKAIGAKGSVKYGRASGNFGGKGEGAKEYLGTLEM